MITFLAIIGGICVALFVVFILISALYSIACRNDAPCWRCRSGWTEEQHRQGKE